MLQNARVTVLTVFELLKETQQSELGKLPASPRSGLKLDVVT